MLDARVGKHCPLLFTLPLALFLSLIVPAPPLLHNLVTLFLHSYLATMKSFMTLVGAVATLTTLLPKVSASCAHHTTHMKRAEVAAWDYSPLKGSVSLSSFTLLPFYP